MERRLHPLSLSKGYPDKKGREDEGGSSGREVIRRTEKISFPALYGENSISWENLAERWEIYPPNIDNHLFISWQQQGRKKKCTSLLWNGVGWVFPLFLVFFCSAADGSLFRRQHAAVVLITESVIIGEGAFAASAA